jgi:hypothetical protein
MKRKIRSARDKKVQILCLALSSLLFVLTACGKTAFTPTPVSEASTSPGSFTIPPNVDILVIQDDTGSMNGVNLESEVPSFLSDLNNKDWNFHFAVAPLTKFREVTQVAGSKYDSNMGDLWTPPYPGATQDLPGTISSSAFQSPENFSDYLSTSDLSNSLGGFEPGLDNMYQVLTKGFGDTGFLRENSLFVVLMIGNGNDTSKVNYCEVKPGVTMPCELVGQPLCTPTATDPTGGSKTCGSQRTSLDFYKSKFKAFNSKMKFFAAVSKSDSSNCRGQLARKGSRYMELATSLNGKSYDICSTPVSAVFDDLTAKLEAERISLKMRYLFVSQDANPDSIKVTRYVGGDPKNAIVIPRDKDKKNGWEYLGKQDNVDVIYDPKTGTVLGQGSGFAIGLYGSAELSGTDRASIEFLPAGAQKAVSE